jgi:peptide/nickel transport system permease protein
MNRVDYLLRRLFTSLVVIAGVLTLTFVITRILPSDPAQLIAGQRARPEQVAAIRSQLGLDRPLPEQFVRYLGGLARGDLGRSFATKRSVREDLGIFLPATLELVLCGFALALVIGIPAGVLAGANERSAFDRASGVAAILGAAAPVFALALLAQQVFFNQLHWLPLNGRLDVEVSLAHPVTFVTGFLLVDTVLTGNWAAWRDALGHLILPALVVAVYPLAIVLRMTRNSMVDALHQPHITVARAKGLTERAILLRHALRNAILPVLTIAGLMFAYAITGTILVELLFRWPGVGKYVADAIVAKDFPPILAVTLVSTVIFVGVTFLMDMLRTALDPRVRG